MTRTKIMARTSSILLGLSSMALVRINSSDCHAFAESQ
jgi:hypothetical protein